MDLNPEVVNKLQQYGVGRRGFDDPFFDDAPPPRLGVYDVDEEDLYQKITEPSACSVPGCRFAGAPAEQARHYELAHRYVCAACRRVLPSPHLLHLHLEETHDSFFAVLAERKPSFSCYTEDCTEKFWNAEERLDHCVKIHKLPKDFRLEQTGKKPQKTRPKDCDTLATGELSSGTLKPRVLKGFSFGQGCSKSFQTNGNRFANTKRKAKEKHVDMDVIVSDLKDSLPE